MSFLSVAFLFALPLVAAPLLLHLFDRRRKVEIEWGAMEFLIAASSRKSSARRFKQWLLLLLRMLAITALILALARPLIPGGWFGGSHRQELIVVIDNSMSMSRGNEDQTFIDLARDRALAEIRELKSGDRVRLMTAAPYPVWNQAGSLRADENDRQTITSQINSLEPTLGRSDLLAAVLTASTAQPEPLAVRRRIVVLSDGQSGDLRLKDTAGWERFQSSVEQAPLPTEVSFIRVTNQRASRGNVAVDEVMADRLLVGVDQTIKFSAKVHNHSKINARSLNVTWHSSDRTEQNVEPSSAMLPMQESVVASLDGGQTELVHWEHAFDRPGVFRSTCRIEHEDDLVSDNLASVVVEVVEEIPILIVEGNSDLSMTQQDSFFTRAALGWLDDVGSDSGSIHVPTIVQTSDLARQPLDRYRCIVIPNLVDFDDESLHGLREFVFSGGGLWVALGPRTNLDRFNAQFFSGGNNLVPLAIEGIVDESIAETSTVPIANELVRINPFGQEHPATAMLADNERLDLGDVIVQRRMKFKMGAIRDEPSVLLSLSNGDPLAVEKLYGRGRVIAQGIPLMLQWSDLATAEAFVVMVRDWADYLAQPKSTRFNLNPGDTLVYRNTDDRIASENITDARLETPDGDPIDLTSDTLSGDAVFQTSRTRLPGSYSLQLGLSDPPLPFEISRDPAESDLTPLSPTEEKTLSELAGLKSTGNGEILTGNQQTDPLWPWLLMALIVFISAELVLSGFLSRERFGDQTEISSRRHEVTGGPSLARLRSVNSLDENKRRIAS